MVTNKTINIKHNLGFFFFKRTSKSKIPPFATTSSPGTNNKRAQTVYSRINKLNKLNRFKRKKKPQQHQLRITMYQQEPSKLFAISMNFPFFPKKSFKIKERISTK